MEIVLFLVAMCGLSRVVWRQRGTLVWIAGVAGICFWCFAGGSAWGQQVVHAVTGTVTDTSTSANTFTLKAANGTLMMFQPSSKREGLDKGLAALVSSAPGLSKVGSQVLVFFYGNDSVLTAAGVETLGEVPITRVMGFVDGFDKHKHTLMLKGVAAGAASATMSEKTVVDTPGGVVEGLHYKPNKGERVGVISSGAGGGATVWLVSATGPNASL